MINLKDKKTIKTLLVLIALLISMLVFPNIAQAAGGMNTGDRINGTLNVTGGSAYTLKTGNNRPTLSDLMNNNVHYFYRGTSSSDPGTFNNKSLYCVQSGARLFTGYDYAPYVHSADVTVTINSDATVGTIKRKKYAYTVTNGSANFWYVRNWGGVFGPQHDKKITHNSSGDVTKEWDKAVSSDEWKEIQGYLYLLYSDDAARTTGTIKEDIKSAKQYAIWAYINKELSDWSRKALAIPDSSESSKVTIGSNYIIVKAISTSSDNKVISTITYGSATDPKSQAAYTLYKNAVAVKNEDASNAAASKIYTGKMHHFINAVSYINTAYGTQQLQINEPMSTRVKDSYHFRLMIRKVTALSGGTGLNGATFSIKITQEGVDNPIYRNTSINTTTRSGSGAGYIDTGTLSLGKNTKDITVRITETKAPSGYEETDGTLKIVYKYNKTTNQWEIKSSSGIDSNYWKQSFVSTDHNTISIKNDADTSPDELGFKLTKKDSDSGDTLSNAKFKITLKDKDGNAILTSGNMSTTLTTNSNGVIKIDKSSIKIDDAVNQSPITITVEELTPPTDYKAIGGKIILKANYNSTSGKWTVTNSNVSGGGKSSLIQYASGNYVATKNGFLKVVVGNTLDIPKVALQITKYGHWIDNSGNNKYSRLDGVKFNIKFKQDGRTLWEGNLTTQEIDGYTALVRTDEIQPTSKNRITVIVTEDANSVKDLGYLPIRNSFTIYYDYDSSSDKWKATVPASLKDTVLLEAKPGATGYDSYAPYTNTSIKIWVTNEYIPYLNLIARKIDNQGNVITDEDVIFAVKYEQDGETIYEDLGVNLTSTGYLEIKKVRPKSLGNITATLTELDSGQYFIKEDQNPIILKFNYNSISNGWELFDKGSFDQSINVSVIDGRKTEVTFNIENMRIPGISINDDATSTDLEEGFTKYVRTRIPHAIPEEGVKFTATFEQEQAGGTKYSETYNGESGSDGHVVFKDGSGNLAVFQPKNINYDVTVVVHEVPDEKHVAAQDKKYTFKYDKASNTWVRTDKASEASNYSRTNTTENVTYEVLDEVVNVVKITSLTVVKQDPRNSSSMAGAKFDITLDNVAKYKLNGVEYTNTTITSFPVPASGEIVLTDVEVQYADEDVIVTLKEVEAPNDSSGNHYYKPIEGDIVVTLTRQNREYTISDIEVEDQTYLYKESSYEVVDSSGVTDNKVSIVVNNIPLIKIAGQVWQDGQTNEKQVIPPDKHKGGSGDKWLEGVHVYLYDIQGGSLGELVDEDVTDENGHYGVFEDLEQTDEGYQIIFEYNGIWYEGLTIGGDNDAQENSNERSSFNNRFTTITKDQSNDGTQLSYDYDESTETSKLEAENDGTNGATGELDFAIKGYTNSVNKIDLSVDCGLEERFFDLALGTDIQSALVTINGQETTYSYAQIMDLANNTLDVKTENFKNKSSDIGAPIYNLYLYVSDYNYRIEDYVTDATEDNFTNPPGNEDRTEIEHNKNEDDELKVYVTYSVILKDQSANGSAEPGKVNSFVYYYDEKYTPVNLDTTKFTDYPSEHKIVYNGSENLVAPDYRATETITFEVDLNAIDPETVDPSDPEAVQFSNVAEITSYSSAGFIDYDSAPENVEVERNSYGSVSVEAYYEDDTDQANGINIIVAPKKVRTIEGTVFEDINKDGENNDNTPVNDVIVQLIEVKKINGNYYEYIWQETRSGHSEVNVINQDGFTEDSYNNGVTEAGKFEFRNYIPGNYIIRYIYGDGATATYGLTEAVQKYNGEDYKSTKEIGEEYTSIWYNTSTEFGNPTLSKARDNEARRLEAMTYSIAIDTELGATLDAFMNNKTLTAPVGSDQYLSDQQRAAILDYYNANPNAAGERSGIRADYDEAVDHMGEAYYFLVANRIAGIFDISAGEDLPEAAALYEDLYDQIMRYVSFKTWMCAETSRINVPVDEGALNGSYNDSNEGYATSVANQVIEDKNSVSFGSMNFGLTLRPQTTLELEKHITGLKITPTGVGVQPIVDATADIKQILTDRNINSDNLTGVKTGLTAMPSLRSDDNNPTRNERGWWKLETDIEELTQGANLEAKYTYAIRNESEKDYLSNGLVEAYKDAVVAGQIQDYIDVLNEKKAETKIRMRNGTYSYKNNATIGQNLGHYYYTGVYKAGVDTPVVAQVERIEESINNDLTFVQQKSVRTNVGDYTSGNYIDAATQEGSVAFAVKGTQVPKQYLNTNGLSTNTTIDTVVETTPSIVFLESVNEPGTVMTDYTDYTQVLAVEKVLSSSGSEGIGTDLPSYMVQVTKYTSATGGRDIRSVPGNLRYIHSEDNGEIAAEMDEFWGERIIISKPTGEDKMQPLQIAVVAISAAAILGVGIVLIRRVVLKK